jgi:purine-binding chemotaxis protein CheW
MVSTAVIQTNQFLTFSLDGEHYAVGVGSVREVLEKTAITQMPKTPDYMRGIINIRGSVVPIIDLRLKLGLSLSEDTVDTCIIVTEIELTDKEIIVLGLLVDSVDEVVEIRSDEIDPAPKIGHRIDTDFIAGIGKLEDRFIIILNSREIFEVAEIDILTQVVD